MKITNISSYLIIIIAILHCVATSKKDRSSETSESKEMALEIRKKPELRYDRSMPRDSDDEDAPVMRHKKDYGLQYDLDSDVLKVKW